MISRNPSTPRTGRRRRAPLAAALLALSLVPPLTPAPAAGDSEELVKLCDAYWEHQLRTNPVQATSLGDHRYDDRLEDISPEGIARDAAVLADLLGEVNALDPQALSPDERITRNALRFQIQSRLSTLACDFESWVVDPMGGPQVEFFNIPSLQPLTDVASGEAMLGRWRAMGPYVDQHVTNLRRGLAEGKVTYRKAVEKTIAEIDELESTPVEEWALMKPALDPPENWSDAEKESFRTRMQETLSKGLRPALLRYRDMLKAEILPRARGDDEPGLMHVPEGDACYREMILRHTSLDLGPEEIHEIGLAEVQRINGEMRDLGERVMGTRSLEEIHRRLREDPALHFRTRDEVEAKAEEALRRAEAAAPKWFGVLPQAPCQVVRIGPHEEKYSTIAYYRRPAADGSRPGSYYINTYAPETRPRYEAEALAFHESVPGHHLQISIMQELDDLPDFRRHSGVTAFVEGWGLYTERLSREMGLYSGETDLFGMLSYDSWRACRLVVDTGMHAMGWTRQQAVDFMIANSVLAENNIANEVDRYITWPGQALAYKLGQREIFRLRALAKDRLGDRFDIRAFHDTVLGEGAVDLRTLAAIVEEWIENVGSEGGQAR